MFVRFAILFILFGLYVLASQLCEAQIRPIVVDGPGDPAIAGGCKPDSKAWACTQCDPKAEAAAGRALENPGVAGMCCTCRWCIGGDTGKEVGDDLRSIMCFPCDT